MAPEPLLHNHWFMKKSVFVIIATGFLAFMGCDSEGTEVALEVSPESIVLYSEGTTQITTNVGDVAFVSNDTYYATVDDSGLVTANKVGKTSINVYSKNNGANRGVVIPVEVIPKYSIYPEIDGLIGKGLNDITRVMGSNYVTSTTSDGDMMYTYNQPTTYAAGIGFTLKNGICSSIIVAIPTSYTTMISKYLLERYRLAGMQNDHYFFVNHGESVLIALTVYSTSMIAVMYMENS